MEWKLDLENQFFDTPNVGSNGREKGRVHALRRRLWMIFTGPVRGTYNTELAAEVNDKRQS